MIQSQQLLKLPRQGTVLTMIDMQERLAAVMDPVVLGEVVKYNKILLAAARTLDLPVVVTEQYPKGLGPTLGQFRESMSESTAPIEKLDFNCARAPGYLDKLRDVGATDVILSGMEAHICVLQSACGLIAEGLRVWVAQDAICSRSQANYQAALRLLESIGAVVAPTETLLFLLLKKSGSPEFKAVSQLIK